MNASKPVISLKLQLWVLIALSILFTMGVLYGQERVQPRFGIPIDPSGQSEISQTGGTVGIVAPSVETNLMINGNQDAPRVLQAVFGDFTLSVKVTGEFDPGDISSNGGSSFNGGGILVWMDESHYLRFERDVWMWRGSEQKNSYYPLIEYWVGAGARRPARNVVGEYKGDSTWLKLQRRGDTLQFWLSHDGKEWIDAGQLESQFPDLVELGFAVVNTSVKPCEVTFSEIELETKPSAF